MRITFVGIGWEQLGLSMMSALARLEGHDVRLAFSASLFNDRLQLTSPALADFFDDTQAVLKDIERQRPDVLAFSPISGTYQWMLSVARKSKLLFPDVKIIFGGVHTTAVPERVLAQPFIDYVCTGEGDIAFPRILKAIEKGGAQEPIPNARFRRPDGQVVAGPQIGFVPDLDALPVFDKPLWEEYMRFGETYVTMASRGCPYRCTYCFNSFFANLPQEKDGKYIRYRSVGHMMHELRAAKRRYGFRMVEFFDDVFTLDKRWLKSFLDQYKKEIGVSYQIFTHIKFVDEDVARWLSESGCRTAQIGIQTLDDEYKRRKLNRHETAAQAAEVLGIMKRYKIHVKFDHMFGLPGEPIDAQETARRFYIKHTPYRITTFWTNFFPGTQMLKEALAQGLLRGEDVETIHEGMCFNSVTITNPYIDRTKNKMYKVYEAMFKLIPALPRPLRPWIRPEIFRHLPTWFLSTITFCGHIVIGIVRWDPDPYYYLTFYFYHIRRFLMVKLGMKPPAATVILDPRPFPLQPFPKEP